jgi:hypothetical protein
MSLRQIRRRQRENLCMSDIAKAEAADAIPGDCGVVPAKAGTHNHRSLLRR